MVLRVGHPSKKGATDTSDARLDFNNRYVCNADGSPRSGVTAPIGTALVTATATMNVTVPAFSAVTVRDGGVVEMANDGSVHVLLDAPPSSQSRIDVIYVKQNDSSSTVSVPDANDLPMLGVLKGTASASPVKRTDLPAGALELGTVLIPSTATATNSSGVVITTTCTYTAAAGGKVPFRTKADLLLWTNPNLGQSANVFDGTATSNGDYLWSGAGWVKDVYDTGWVNLTSTGSAITIDGAQMRIKGGILYQRGGISKSSNFAAGDSVANIPSTITSLIARTDTIRLLGWFGNSVGTLLNIASGATVLTLPGLSTTTSQTLILGGTTPVD
jgi:hypothetical protein